MHPRACVERDLARSSSRSPTTSRSGTRTASTTRRRVGREARSVRLGRGHRARRRRRRRAACASSNLIGLGPFHLADPTQWDAATASGSCARSRPRPRSAPSAWCSRPARSRRSRGTKPPTRSRPRSRPCSREARGARRRRSRSSTRTRCASTSGFVHTLRDAIDLARRLDTGVCMELNACWAERGLADDDPRRRRPHPARAGERLQGRHGRVVAAARARRRRHPDRAHPRRRARRGLRRRASTSSSSATRSSPRATTRPCRARSTRSARCSPSSAPDARLPARSTSRRAPRSGRHGGAATGISRPSISATRAK